MRRTHSRVRVRAGGSLVSEASALMARMTTAPSLPRRQLVNDLIISLKQAGVWAKLDVFYMLAAHNSEAALLNWISTSFNATAQNTPTFTADRGYTFNGTNNYLETGYQPPTGLKFQRDDAALGVWIFARALIRNGNDTSRIGMEASNNYYARGNCTTTVNSTTTVSANRMLAWSRASSANYKEYVDGVAGNTQTQASTALAAFSHNIGRSNLGSPLYGANGNGVRCYFAGQSLSDAEHSSLYTAVQKYLKAVGAA